MTGWLDLPKYLRRRDGGGQQMNSIQVGPVLLWVFVQLAALGLGCSRMAVWAHHPAPRESLAAAEMTAVQVVAGGMLFPYLLPNLLTCCAILGMIWPFLELAGAVSHTSQNELVSTAVLVSIWLGGLGALNGVVKARRALLAVAAINAWVLGGVIFSYLQAEANDKATHSTFIFQTSPLHICIAQITGDPMRILNSILLGFPAALAGIIAIMPKLTRSVLAKRC